VLLGEEGGGRGPLAIGQVLKSGVSEGNISMQTCTLRTKKGGGVGCSIFVLHS
jgi:hypothetical protein